MCAQFHELSDETQRAVRQRMCVSAVCSWSLLLGAIYLGYALLFGRGLGSSGGGTQRFSYAPTHAHFAADAGGGGLEAAWALPRDAAPRGVVLLLPGCNHAATDFFAASKACPTCAPLPEEAKAASLALRRNLAVVAVSQAEACWRAGDTPGVARALAYIARRERWGGLPLFAYGASSGGSVALAAPHWLPAPRRGAQGFPLRLEGVGALIAAAPSPEETLTADYPPAAFVHMPRDARNARRVDEAVERLERLGRPVVALTAGPQAVTEAFVEQRLPKGGPKGEAAGVVAALGAAALLDAEGLLVEDPRRSRWREALRRAGAAPDEARDALQADASPLAEALNVAWAQHEYTAEHFDAVLDFWLRHARMSAMGSGLAGRRVLGVAEAA